MNKFENPTPCNPSPEEIEKTEGTEGKEDLKEYFKERFLDNLKEEKERVEEFKEKISPFLDDLPKEDSDFIITKAAFEKLAGDPRMSKDKSAQLKNLLWSIDVNRSVIKQKSSEDIKEFSENILKGNINDLIKELEPVFPEEVIKELKSIKDKKEEE